MSWALLALLEYNKSVLILRLVRREGKAWGGVSGVMGGCEAYRPLMQQLQLLCTAYKAAVNEVSKP